jgi:hypothetical protein
LDTIEKYFPPDASLEGRDYTNDEYMVGTTRVEVARRILQNIATIIFHLRYALSQAIHRAHKLVQSEGISTAYQS